MVDISDRQTPLVKSTKPGSSFMRARRFLTFRGLRLFTLLLGLAINFTPALIHAQSNNRPHRVLVLYWDNKDFPGNVKFDEAFREVLQQSQYSGNLEYYPEYMETTRFPGKSQEFFRDYLRKKYEGRPMDVVVATADIPLNFMLQYRAELFANCPIVFLANSLPVAETLIAGPGLTGVIHQSTHRETLALALKLHPDTEQVFVISGSLERDKRFETVARRELSGFTDKVEITYLTDLPLNELISRTASLPSNSIALYIWQQSLNEQGKHLETYEVLSRIATTSSVPIYGMGSGNLGQGLVGGYLQGPDTNGAKLAEITLRILSGTRAQDIGIEGAPKVLIFDWRQLQRWGISENQLPPGGIIRFIEFTFWQQYRLYIIGTVSLLLLQMSFIVVLLVERKRRRLARKALAQLNDQLEQLIAERTAALDAKTRELETFAYSVAHDLKAPLRGIDGYSRLLLGEHSEQLNQEGRSFLETIQTSTSEMSQLIDDLLEYSRLERRELRPGRVEIASLVSTVIEQTKRETPEGKVDFVVRVNGCSVVGDANGMLQALRNYVDNAVKFTRRVPAPRIEIISKEQGNNVVLTVRDNGVGFDMKYHDRIFNIFQRLNPLEDYPGTGVGLAIVRKSMERMGGRAWAESQPGQGATFYLEIPKTFDGGSIDGQRTVSNSAG
jgi:signal transduction histidine kinase